MSEWNTTNHEFNVCTSSMPEKMGDQVMSGKCMKEWNACEEREKRESEREREREREREKENQKVTASLVQRGRKLTEKKRTEHRGSTETLAHKTHGHTIFTQLFATLNTLGVLIWLHQANFLSFFLSLCVCVWSWLMWKQASKKHKQHSMWTFSRATLCVQVSSQGPNKMDKSTVGDFYPLGGL